jgi:hypothetical protein
MTHELQILRAEIKQKTSDEKSKSPSQEENTKSVAAPDSSKFSFSDQKSLEQHLTEAKTRITELELEISHLNEDLKMTVLRQKETGASANEALLQLESEIET